MKDGDVSGALRHAFRLATSRFPDDQELATLRTYFTEQREHFLQKPNQATQLLESVKWTQASTEDLASKAAMVMAANVILNLDEVLVRR